MSEGEETAALVWCPCPDLDSARRIAEQLLDERLIACANIFGGIESHFVWEGEKDSARETGLLCKTTARSLDLVIDRIAALHPYDTPAIIGWHSDAAHPATMAWLIAQTEAIQPPQH